jgi:hypothetical protein
MSSTRNIEGRGEEAELDEEEPEKLIRTKGPRPRI